MKKIIVAMFLLLTAIPLHAEEKISYEKDMLFCKQVAASAKSIMDARQRGVEMSRVVDVTNDFKKPDLYMEFITEAYEIPAWSDPDRRDKTIRDFADKQYLSCVKAIRKKHNK